MRTFHYEEKVVDSLGVVGVTEEDMRTRTHVDMELDVMTTEIERESTMFQQAHFVRANTAVPNLFK